MFLYSVSFNTLGKESKLFNMVPAIMSSFGSRTGPIQVTDGQRSGNHSLTKIEIIATERGLRKSHFLSGNYDAERPRAVGRIILAPDKTVNAVA
jgi:hypothetical protein